MTRSFAGALLLCALMGVAPALAQSTTAPASPPAATSGADKTDKQSVSKACSQQADAKGLHGKERKTFRADCKKNGGKPS